MRYFEVIPLVRLPRSANQTYTYKNETSVKTGVIVSISFHGRTVRGVVSKQVKKKPEYIVKSIRKVVTSKPYFTASALIYIQKIADFYLTPLPEIALLFLPSKYSHQLLESVAGNSPFKKSAINYTHKYLRLVNLKHDFSSLKKDLTYRIKHKQQILILSPTIQQVSQIASCLRDLMPDVKQVVLTSNTASSYVAVSKEQPLICIGTRHAAFAPFNKLSCVIQYDATNDAHVQWDQHPKYNVSQVISLRKQSLPLSFIQIGFPPSGDTPLDNDVTKDLQNNITITSKKLSPGNFHPLNKTLQDLYQQTSGTKRWLFYLNRLGLQRQLTCSDCGWEARCKNCDLILTVKSQTELRCERCEETHTKLLTCPSCKGANLTSLGVGIDLLKTAVQKLSPKVTVKQIDATTISNEDFYESKTILATDALSRYAPIGSFDYVVMVNADGERSLPLWNAEERFLHKLFQLIAHTTKLGRVYIQSNNQDETSKALMTFSNQDYKKLQQIRKKLLYPPYGEQILLSKKSSDKLDVPEKLKELIHKEPKQFSALQRYTDNRGVWLRLFVRVPSSATSFKKQLYAIVPKDWYIEINPRNL